MKPVSYQYEMTTDMFFVPEESGRENLSAIPSDSKKADIQAVIEEADEMMYQNKHENI